MSNLRKKNEVQIKITQNSILKFTFFIQTSDEKLVIACEVNIKNQKENDF